jgi:predicted P-loop ATPase
MIKSTIITKQEAAIKYTTENYLDYNRLRHDIISDKLQVRDEHSLESFRMVQNSVELSSAENTTLHHSTQPLHHSTPCFWREMSKHDINSIVCHAAQEYDQNITSREVLTALQSDLIPDVHPLREYIQSLKPYTNDQPDWIDWVASQVRVKNNDNTDNLRGNQLPAAPEENNSTPSCTTLHNTTPSADRLWRICFKKWFVAMVASWMNDEVVNHQVLVLIGRQGIYKTTWLEHLIPPHLRAYACKLANSAELNKDDRLRIAEFGLISLDEIDSMNTRELNQLKSVITATDVNERAAYGYTKERRIRLASFCASGNRRDFLTDITGNRRWLPFEVESIQNPFFTTLPYERMYAQAWALANDPTFCYWFELDEIEVLEEHNKHFRDESNEEQLLPILFDVPAEGKGEFMTTAQISERLVTYGNIKKPMALSRLGMVLGTVGYKAISPRINGTRTRGWIVYQRNRDEIETMKRLLKE